MSTVYIDFETRSTADLRKVGVYVYAEHPDTEVILVAWAVNDAPVSWAMIDAPETEELRALLADPGVRIVAHNAGFERLMLKYVLARRGWPAPDIGRFDCTAARAARLALPRSLDGAATVLGLDHQKDRQGHALMMRCCRPRSVADDGTIMWWEDGERMARLGAYCATDVEVERELDRILPMFDEGERAIWELTEKINDRGVPVDIGYVTQAMFLAEETSELLDAKMRTVTGGLVPNATNVPRLREWFKGHGRPIDSLDKAAITKLLANPHLLKVERAALQIRQEAGKSSVKKFKAISDRTSDDARVRGNLVYHGASPGRWAGAGVQMQNMPRNVVKDFDAVEQDVYVLTAEEFGTKYGSTLNTLTGTLRGSIVAPKGKKFVWADYAAVEARGVAWLAGASKLTQRFREDGAIYEEMAAAIYGVPVGMIKNPSTERFVGKTVILGCFAADTKVLTDKGPKAIVDVTQSDMVWDGGAWAAHGGVIYQGLKETETAFGLTATPDHEILTGRSWQAWHAVHTSPSLFRSALALGGLPSSASSNTRAKMAEHLTSHSCGAIADGKVSWTGTMSRRAARASAMLAASARRIRNAITSIAPRWPTTTTGCGCSTGFQLASAGATTPAPRHSATTAGAAFPSTPYGVQTAPRFSNTCRQSTGGITRRLTWTARTMIAAMSRGTSGSSRPARTCATAGRSVSCKSASAPLKQKTHVYDLLNAGPKHRFTVLTDAGPIIVHNCGYGMGVDKFEATCAAQGVILEPGIASIAVGTYRSEHHQIPALWKGLGNAAISATLDLNTVYNYRAIKFKRTRDSKGDWLRMRLPNGRYIWYCNPRVTDGKYGDVLEYDALHPMTKQWGPETTWGGKLTENAVQGICRDLMANAMLLLESYRYPCILSVHDEVIAEVPDDTRWSRDAMVGLMTVVPHWARDFPLKAEGKEGYRYGK